MVMMHHRVLAEHQAATRAGADIIRAVEHVVIRRLHHKGEGLGRRVVRPHLAEPHVAPIGRYEEDLTISVPASLEPPESCAAGGQSLDEH